MDIDIDSCLIVLKEMYRKGEKEHKIEVYNTEEIEALKYAMDMIDFVKLIKYRLSLTK